MEYNTQRPQLKIADYGRTVQKMIEQARQLPTRELRTAMAETIIGVMTQLNPKVKERTDYMHILWDHLMIMADYDFDCDCPYTIVREETEHFHPNRIPLPGNKIRYRHYGRAIEDMVRAVSAMPASPGRDTLTCHLASAMKRQYLQWNRDTVDDKLIEEQLLEISEGKLTLPEGFSFRSTDEVLAAMSPQPAGASKKKKKKKKKTTAS